jgi:folate-dependent phosphoribosylglycinamide formyltransferase PurN
LGAGTTLLVARDGDSTRIVLNALLKNLPDVHVILEDPPSRLRMLSRRARRLGIWEALGQAVFVMAVAPVLRRRARRRIAAIVREHSLDLSPPKVVPHHVRSINSEAARGLMREIDPSVVVVNGTRIIGRKTLACVDAVFMNMHAGITPLYRGVHGGYWALADGNNDLVGTTVHVVDEGIDTGRVIGQATFDVTDEDTFATYPYLHLAAGLPLLREAVARALSGEPLPEVERRELPSQLRYHPTVWSYLATRSAVGVR